MANEKQIRNVIENFDAETVKDALSLLLSKTNGSSNVSQAESSSSGASFENQKFNNFAQAIMYLKSKYKFQELEAFTTEADLVYVNTGDRKILLTDTTVKPRVLPKETEDDGFVSSTEEPQEQKNENKDDFDNAFEPRQKSSRFSNLEL
ncbi:MAG: hypothetical protein KBS84_01450 [Treponema sp.]|nr:hypothetical protein [Candidatus Treponema scatequi]